MAHFAKLDSNNNVIDVVVVNNDVLGSPESEATGITFLTNLTGHSIWKQCSYNSLGGQHLLGGTAFRKNYPGPGFIYDMTRDAFIAPQPFSSWLLNDTTCMWEPPVARPDDGKKYNWDEKTISWELAE